MMALEGEMIDYSNIEMTALLFCSGSNPREEFIREWAEEVREKSKAKGLDINSPDYTLTWVGLNNCGGHAAYRTVDDIPLVDVPCPCGNPRHWLIRYD